MNAIKILQKIRNILILMMIPAGIIMVRLPNTFIYRNNIFTLHESFGVIFAAILFFIIATSIVQIIQSKVVNNSTQKLPLKIKIIRSVMLFLNIIIVASGFLLIFYYAMPVKFFELFEIASPFSKNIILHKNFELMHEYCAYTIAFVIIFLQANKFIINKKSK